MEMINILLSPIKEYIEIVKPEFDSIPENRILWLSEIALYISEKRAKRLPVNLTFICTHNSRRSHMAQFWAAASSVYYNVRDIHCFSGGTEATAFNPRAVKALANAGFQIEKQTESANPIYKVRFAEYSDPENAFSKRYSDPVNPQSDFAAVMTCSDADEACPIVYGADARFPLTYEDPKNADGSASEALIYDERCRQIAVEMLFLFSQVKQEIINL